MPPLPSNDTTRYTPSCRPMSDRRSEVMTRFSLDRYTAPCEDFVLVARPVSGPMSLCSRCRHEKSRIAVMARGARHEKQATSHGLCPMPYEFTDIRARGWLALLYA